MKSLPGNLPGLRAPVALSTCTGRVPISALTSWAGGRCSTKALGVNLQLSPDCGALDLLLNLSELPSSPLQKRDRNPADLRGTHMEAQHWAVLST
jgi:hypothetical protein